MPFDKAIFATWLTNNALHPYGKKQCATHVRKAIEAAGLSTIGHPELAKDWGPTLLRIGFIVVPGEPTLPMLGDIAVMQTTSKSNEGHIEGYNGTKWVSDYIQEGFWPGPTFRTELPAHVIYRHL